MAVVDATKALDIQPKHVKSLSRKGKALHSLHRYKEAVICLNTALDSAPKHTELEAACRRSRECNTQCTSGKYDLSSFIYSGYDERNAPECADFIGNVIIRLHPDSRKGRGLFVTKDVRCGDVLLVSNAVAVSHAKENAVGFHVPPSAMIFNTVAEDDLVTQLVDRAMNSTRIKQQIYSLASHIPPEGMEVPSMDLFAPNLSSKHAEEADSAENCSIDVERIRGVVKANAFGEGKWKRGWSGVWLTPSFINHSCTPNASYIFVGEALYVHATRNLEAGQEVTVSYFDVLLPYRNRMEEMKKWGFRCKCERCRVKN